MPDTVRTTGSGNTRRITKTIGTVTALTEFPPDDGTGGSGLVATSAVDWHSPTGVPSAGTIGSLSAPLGTQWLIQGYSAFGVAALQLQCPQGSLSVWLTVRRGAEVYELSLAMPDTSATLTLPASDVPVAFDGYLVSGGGHAGEGQSSTGATPQLFLIADAGYAGTVFTRLTRRADASI